MSLSLRTARNARVFFFIIPPTTKTGIIISMTRVPFYLDWMGSVLDKPSDWLLALGRLESHLLTYDIADITIDKPIFVTGMARAGSTVLLEALNDASVTSSFQYRDYPFIHANYFWNIVRLAVPTSTRKKQRAHQDGIDISLHSPEALEEILWTAFYPPSADRMPILNAPHSDETFAAYYQNSIKKLLYLRKGTRYLAKNNNLIARLPYLRSLFPDARFIVPLRDPAAHIYSLIKQHRLISDAQKADPASARYMRRNGHFEFGQDFRPIAFEGIDQVIALWHAGEIVQAYAHYWRLYHMHIAQMLDDDTDLRAQCCLITHEALCDDPKASLSRISEFCMLPPSDAENIKAHWAARLKRPTYYHNDFSDDEITMIEDITRPAQEQLWRMIG